MATQFPPKSDASGLKPREVSQRNDIIGLTAIHRFRWLRPREIGNILWVNAEKSRQVAGARICKKWLARGYVIQRKLPLHYGYAYVLSQSGANFLIEHGVPEATTGKRVGDFVGSAGKNKDQLWLPTKLTFEHDLLATGFLTLMLGNGLEIKTEAEIARLNQQEGRKIPDGLVQLKTGEWMAIEVERSRKYGEHMRALCRNFVTIDGTGVEYVFRDETNDNVQHTYIPVKRIALVFEDLPEKDVMGRKTLNHLDAITPQLQAEMKGDESLLLTVIKLVCEGDSVLSFSAEKVEIKPSWEAALSKYLLGNDWYWRSDNNYMKNLDFEFSSYGRDFKKFVSKTEWKDKFPFEVYIWQMKKDYGTGWRIEMRHEWVDQDFASRELHDEYFKPFFSSHLTAIEENSAQAEALRLLQKTSEYRQWFKNKWCKENGISLNDDIPFNIDDL